MALALMTSKLSYDCHGKVTRGDGKYSIKQTGSLWVVGVALQTTDIGRKAVVARLTGFIRGFPNRHDTTGI